MGPIGCASNPVSPQNGNWEPNRAGWCPGMEVPVRINKFNNNLSGDSNCSLIETKNLTASLPSNNL